MIEFLLAGSLLLVFLLAIFQCSLLWAGKGAVDTAAHFAARAFARSARLDLRRAREAAFREAFRICRNRPGGALATASMTALDITSSGKGGANRASSGDAVCVRLTHGVELIVPWADRILYALSPGEKTRVGNHFYLMLHATRWVTVE